MARRNFYDIIKNSKFNVESEYERVHHLLHSTDYTEETIYTMIEEAFMEFPESFRGRTISLNDFNKTYGFVFIPFSGLVRIDDFISYCEYIHNLCNQLLCCEDYKLYKEDIDAVEFLLDTIEGAIDELGYISVEKDDVLIYIEKDPAAISVAEIVPEEIAFSVLEYNHYRLKGDLVRKREILRNMADNIEDKSIRGDLKQINGTLESQLYQLLNKFVRHDHSQTPHIATMTDDEIEAVYDDIYQMWLLAQLELDHLDRKNRMKSLLEQINA